MAKLQVKCVRCNFAANGHTGIVHKTMPTYGQELNIHRPDPNTSNALYCAIKNEDIQTAWQLLSDGEDVNVGISTLQYNGSVTRYPLGIAAEMGNITLLKLLLDNGANANVQERHSTAILGSRGGQTPLHFAVHNLDLEIIRILLEHGARTDLRNRNGNTPFHELVRSLSDCKRHLPVLQILCQSSKNPNQLNVLNNVGFTALYLATVHHCTSSVFHMLLQAGADPNRPLGKWGSLSPLWMAVHMKNPELVRILVQNGSNLNVTYSGKTMLMEYMNSYPIMGMPTKDIPKTLILHGTTLKNLDKKGLTVIGMCIENMREDNHILCQMLLYAGCKLNQESWLRPYSRKQSEQEYMCSWLRKMQCNPLKLQDLTRITIRTYLNEKVLNGKSVVAPITQLPLPQLMKEYLLLDEVICER